VRQVETKTGGRELTYDQWKTTDPRDGDYDPQDDVSELDLVYDQLREAKEDAKHAAKVSEHNIAVLRGALDEALEYFKARYDVKDGGDGQQLPNEEMRIGTMIDETLYGIRF
jgi:hypothetical protein